MHFFSWDFGLPVCELDQNFEFAGTIGYGNSYLEFLFRHFNVFRPHTLLHDAAGALRVHSGKRLDCCYVIGHWPNSCLLGHVTGVLFCFYVRLFLPSFFNSVGFWSSMYCIVLDIDLADENVFKELGVFCDGKVQGYAFRPPKKYKLTKPAFWCTRNLHGIACNSGRLDYSELLINLHRTVKDEYFAKGTEKCKIRGNFLDKEVETLENHGCARVQDIVDEEMWICSRYPFRHKTTLHCAERTAKMFGNWILRHLLL